VLSSIKKWLASAAEEDCFEKGCFDTIESQIKLLQSRFDQISLQIDRHGNEDRGILELISQMYIERTKMIADSHNQQEAAFVFPRPARQQQM
jgi:hypothetical protein